MTGHEDQDRHANQLGAGEALARILGVQQQCDQVLAGIFPAQYDGESGPSRALSGVGSTGFGPRVLGGGLRRTQHRPLKGCIMSRA